MRSQSGTPNSTPSSRQVREWADGGASIAISVPPENMVEPGRGRPAAHGHSPRRIGSHGRRRHEGVHVGTLHRFKGLEYQRMILVGVTDGRSPESTSSQIGERPAATAESKRARSLLFVAATRARDMLGISWHGQPSRFLTSAP